MSHVIPINTPIPRRKRKRKAQPKAKPDFSVETVETYMRKANINGFEKGAKAVIALCEIMNEEINTKTALALGITMLQRSNFTGISSTHLSLSFTNAPHVTSASSRLFQ